MSQERKAIIALAIALFVVCTAMACLSGLIVGGAWMAVTGNRTSRLPRLIDREYPSLPMTPEPREGPEHMAVVALVTQVTEDSPAHRAGIQIGDLILAIDGERLERGSGLRELLSEYQPGDRVELTIQRGNRKLDVQVKLGHHPENQRRPYLGVTYRLVPISPE